MFVVATCDGGVIDGGTFTATPTSTLDRLFFRPFWIAPSAPVAVNLDSGTDEYELAYHDRILDVTNEWTSQDYEWEFTIEPGRILEPYSRNSTNAFVIAPAGGDEELWMHSRAGTATISIEWSTGSVSAEVVSGTDNITRVFNRWKTGSLAEDIAEEFDALVAVSSDMEMFTTFSPPDTFVRNPDFWAAGIDLTCLAVWNSYGWSGGGGPQRAGTLITPKHVAAAAHFYLPVGTVLKFVTADNEVITRTVINTIGEHDDLSAMFPWYVDFSIAELDAPVPSSITPAKILPANFHSKIFTPTHTQAEIDENGYVNWREDSDPHPYPLPVLRTNQFNQGDVAEIRFADDVGLTVTFGTTYSIGNAGSMPPRYSAARLALYTGPQIAGDSGHPTFLIINSQAVLLTHAYATLAGPTWAAAVDAVNAKIIEWGSDYLVTPLDLNAYPSF